MPVIEIHLDLRLSLTPCVESLVKMRFGENSHRPNVNNSLIKGSVVRFISTVFCVVFHVRFWMPLHGNGNKSMETHIYSLCAQVI